MIEYDQSFHQRLILINMENHLLILLRMDDSNQPHMEKLRFMSFMVDDNIKMSMPKLNDKYYFPPVT